MIEVGPLVFSADRLLAILLAGLFLTFAGLIGRRLGKPLSERAAGAVIAGIIGARLGYVGKHYETFLAEPWAALAIWQGGFTPWAGLAAGVIYIFAMHRSARSSVVLAFVAVLLFAAYTAASVVLDRREQVPFPQQIRVETLQGTTVELVSLHGEPFVVNLWASWCGPCRREMPMLIDVAEESSVPILMINQGEDQVRVLSFLQSEEIPSDMVLLDTEQTLSVSMGSRALPVTLFVDAGGMIQESHVGEISRAALLDGIAQIEGSPQ